MAEQFAYGNIVKGYWRTYIYSFVLWESETQIAYRFWFGVNWVAPIKGNSDSDNYWCEWDESQLSVGHQTKWGFSTKKLTRDWYNSDADKCYGYDYIDWTFEKYADGYSASAWANINHDSNGATYKGSSSVTAYVWIPARRKFTISFNGNPKVVGDTVGNVPSPITKSYSYAVKLPLDVPTESGFKFVGWGANPNATTATYTNGGAYYLNGDATLYAIWSAVDPPKLSNINFSKSTTGDDIIRGFTSISCSYAVSYVRDGRSLTSVTLNVAGHTASSSNSSGTLTVGGTGADKFVEANEGTRNVILTAVDSEGAITNHVVRNVNIIAPTWSKRIVVNQSQFPSKDKDGNAILESLEIINYHDTTDPLNPVYDAVSVNGLALIDNGDHTWSFDYVFDENHVSNPSSTSPTVGIRTAYKHYDTEVPASNEAFYNTSRNQNYSNGIYNVMFVGGVDNTQFPAFTSRAWWCRINNPLYFPDTNYIEVGSNDTGIQGLTKVGDYLAVIKQSKTTDTAIFLLYPTSFEDETTYAVKQGIQGVGALSRYSFNILGDETLFLSPKGVMAIVPSQDEEHKVQNRSFFVDKRLLAETGIENAYSFVFDGKYFLSTGNGHVYVLDGNQRNSWGNDKTNLVYECYFLDNVPANCFVKFNDRLVFSDGNNVCSFGELFTDAYDGDEVNVPVKAEWSTIFDDDGSLHYYKTMQKKGNLVSILPLENEKPYKQVAIDVDTFNEDKPKYYVLENGEYVQCDQNTDFTGTYTAVTITESQFNENKKAYYIVVNDEYVRCTDDTVYSALETYYTYLGTYFVENRSGTKVLVKKDGNEPVEIQRKFGLQSDVPSELFINKKFKKYKRLQFILTNDTDEDFGVDEIVKNYTVGNYAKK